MKTSQEVREKLEEKPDTELESLIDELDQKIVDRKPISNRMLKRCRKKAVAQSILDNRNNCSRSETVTRPVSKSRGQQGLEAFSQG